MFFVLLQKNKTFSRSFMFFAKECCVFCVLLRSLQKNAAFFAFFYNLCKRMLRSLRSERSFGSHKLPKTRKKNGTIFKRTEFSEQKRTRCPTLLISDQQKPVAFRKLQKVLNHSTLACVACLTKFANIL